MIALDRLQTGKPSYRQTVLVPLASIDQSIDVLGEDLSHLQKYRVISLHELLIDAQRALNGGEGYGLFDRTPVCTENPIRVYRMIESAKLAR
jgi:hypothetical protein